MSHLINLSIFGAQCFLLICLLSYTIYSSISYKVSTNILGSPGREPSINLTKIAQFAHRNDNISDDNPIVDGNVTTSVSNKTTTDATIPKQTKSVIGDPLAATDTRSDDGFVIVELTPDSIAWLEMADIDNGSNLITDDNYKLLNSQSIDTSNEHINETYIMRLLSISSLIVAQLIAVAGCVTKKRSLISLHHVLISTTILFMVVLQSFSIARKYQKQISSVSIYAKYHNIIIM